LARVWVAPFVVSLARTARTRVRFVALAVALAVDLPLDFVAPFFFTAIFVAMVVAPSRQRLSE
jgi:hypothetical protein